MIWHSWRTVPESHVCHSHAVLTLPRCRAWAWAGAGSRRGAISAWICRWAKKVRVSDHAIRQLWQVHCTVAHCSQGVGGDRRPKTGGEHPLTQERLHIRGVAAAVARWRVAAHGDPGACVGEAVDSAGALEHGAANLGGGPPDDLRTFGVRGQVGHHVLGVVSYYWSQCATYLQRDAHTLAALHLGPPPRRTWVKWPAPLWKLGLL